MVGFIPPSVTFAERRFVKIKKKALTVILPLCVAIAITACGGNADATEVEETTVIEESTEADGQEEAEAEEQGGNPEADACYEAGRRSLYGLYGVQIDMEDAYTNFTKAQELGNTDANFYLGVLADSYYGYLKVDFEQARAYYEQSDGNPYAQIALGCLYYYELCVGQDMEKGKELFQSVADQGVVEGYYGLAMVARNEEDFETALEYYSKVVEEGTEQLYIADAMTSLGNIYQYGDGVGQDGAQAIEWYTKAVDLGYTMAISCIGSMYEYGDGVEQDIDKAIEWYAKGAELGDYSSELALERLQGQ